MEKVNKKDLEKVQGGATYIVHSLAELSLIDSSELSENDQACFISTSGTSTMYI